MTLIPLVVFAGLAIAVRGESVPESATAVIYAVDTFGASMPVDSVALVGGRGTSRAAPGSAGLGVTVETGGHVYFSPLVGDGDTAFVDVYGFTTDISRVSLVAYKVVVVEREDSLTVAEMMNFVVDSTVGYDGELPLLVLAKHSDFAYLGRPEDYSLSGDTLSLRPSLRPGHTVVAFTYRTKKPLTLRRTPPLSTDSVSLLVQSGLSVRGRGLNKGEGRSEGGMPFDTYDVSEGAILATLGGKSFFSFGKSWRNALLALAAAAVIALVIFLTRRYEKKEPDAPPPV